MTNGRRPKIALIVSHLRGGGKEQCVVTLANTLAENGIDSMIICLEKSGPLQTLINHANVEVVTLNKRKGNDLWLPMRLARVLRSKCIDVVHSNNWGTLVESVLAARWAGTHNIVHTQHGMDYGLADRRTQPRAWLRKGAKQFFSRWLTHVVAVSDEVQSMVINEWRVPSKRVSIIHNGIVPNGKSLGRAERLQGRQSLGLKETDFVIGSVGFFRPVKNFPFLVEVMAKVSARAPEARLVIVGDGPTKGDILSAVHRYGLGDVVCLPGLHTNAYELLPLMDLFVLCSRSEGISLSILEAMATGLPVVATRVGGNHEIVREHETGLLVSPDSPGAAAEAILKLIADPQRRSSMGRQGQARIQAHYSAQRMARDYKTLYATLHA